MRKISDYLIWGGVCGILLSLVFGCSLFGGTDISPSAKMAQKVAQTMKKQEEITQEFKEVKGDIAISKQEFTEFKTEIHNKVDQSTTNHNESLKSLAWTAAGIWFLYEALKFIRALLIAKFSPGSTLKNLVKGK